MAWLKAHPPAGLRLRSNGSGVGEQGPFVSLSYSADISPDYNLASLVIEVVPNGGNASALRADGQTTWIPPRSSAENVPSDLVRVELLARRHTTPLVRRELTGSAAAILARTANVLQRDNRGIVHCAMDTGYRLSVMFVAVGRTLVYTENPACGSVSVTSNGVRQPALLDSAAFHRLVRTDLGLPAHAR